MEIEVVQIEALIPYARNSRQHSPAQVAQIAGSIREFGFTNPILIDKDGGIIAGHGRVLAARQIGMTELPCVRLAHLSDRQRRAYVIADNRLAELATWDMESLLLELGELRMDDEFDMDLTGFSAEAMGELLKDMEEAPAAGLTDPDDVPEIKAEAISKTGDVWLLGRHRLLCGDSTDAGSVERLMAGELADAVLTDPPYGQNQKGVIGDEPANSTEIVKAARYLPIKDAVIVAFQSPRTFPFWLNECMDQGYHFERMLWLYKQAQNAYPWRGWLLKSEAILVMSAGDGKWQDHHPYKHDCYMVSEVSNEIDSSIGWHGSIKPIAVASDIMQRVCPKGSLVYDPFSGSGTTIIASEQTGRRCYAMEIAPEYCDVAVRRWQQYTGQSATLESTGEAFPA